MESLAIILKIMNLYAHNAHNTVRGSFIAQPIKGIIYENF